jgi:hypothetical protein
MDLLFEPVFFPRISDREFSRSIQKPVFGLITSLMALLEDSHAPIHAPFIVPVLMAREPAKSLTPSDAPLSIQLPSQGYGTIKTIPVPFDCRLSNNGKFNSMGDALGYLARHCQFHHGAFTKALVRLYLPYCRLLDLVQGEYQPVRQVPQRVLEAEFHRVQKLTQLL